MSLPQVILKKGREKAVRAGHPWIFSGAIQDVTGSPKPGETIEVKSTNQDFLGMGAWSPKSQMQVRMWSIKKRPIDKAFFTECISAAFQQRQALGLTTTNTAYRLINAESDNLPGVTVDYYDGWLIAQFLTTGAEYWKKTIAEALAEVTQCKGVYERSDVDVRRKEGLEPSTGLLLGEMPPAYIDINEQGRQYRVDVINGHKTGFYLDQRENRSLLQHYAKDKRVLNTFSYTGGFSIAALKGGASHATNIDSSQPALDIATQAAELNGFDKDKMENVNGDVFKLLRDYCYDKSLNKGLFDIIVLDPPKFAENRNQLKKAARAYKDINMLGFKLLKPGGLLFTFSCSGLMEASLFQKIVADAALDTGYQGQIIHKLSQATDHPVKLSFPESYYLKGLVCQKGL